MADASGKSGSPTISSIAAPTADIDDEWALDDAEDAASPPQTTPSNSAIEAAQEAQTSGSPATEEIDSEWPEDAVNADQLRKPKIPLAPKLPEEAAGFESKQVPPAPAAGPSSPPAATSGVPAASEPPISEDSIDRFERAAISTSRGAFGVRSSSIPPAPPAAAAPSTPPNTPPPVSAPPVSTPKSTPPATPEAKSAAAAAVAPSRPPPATELGRASAPAAAELPATTAPVTRESNARTASTAPRAAVTSEAGASEPPRAGKSKKGAALVYGLAAAAIAIAGVGLAMRAPGGSERDTDRAHLELDPASKADSGKAKALPAPVAPPAAPKATEPSEPTPSIAAPGASADANPSAGETPTADADQGSAENTGVREDEGSPDAAASADAPTGTPMLVTVHIYPPEAEIYHKGKRLGRSGQAIELLPGERKLLVLIREGYWPRKLILDGKETTYNIGLRKQADAKAAPGTTGAAPAPAAAPKFTPPTP